MAQQQQRSISFKAFAGVVALLCTVTGVSWGIASKVIGDRLAVEARTVEARVRDEQIAAALVSINSRVGVIEETLSALADNRAAIQVNSQRIADHDRRLDRLEAGSK